MKRTYIIGDVHGCYQPLVNLLELVNTTDDTIVFLGDYIDRGPDSKKVVDLVIQLKKERPRIITLLGNHESMFLRYLDGQDRELFLRSGGQRTIESYGIENIPGRSHYSCIPDEHLSFYNDLLLHWGEGDYIYVHAGLQPGVHLSMQPDSWCLWARDEFISSQYDFGKRVVFGHTVFKEPFVRPEKVGIDTGAVYGGRLTCFVLPDEKFITVPGLHEAKADSV